MIIEKYCDDWKELWWMKNIVMIEKDCANGKGFRWLRDIVIMEKYYDDWTILW